MIIIIIFINFNICTCAALRCTARRFLRFKFQAVHSAHAQIECAHVRTSTAARVEDLYNY